MLLTPREHQEEVLKALREKRKEGAKSALIVMATGLGKTYTSAFDVDQYMSNHDGRALLLCHNNEILRQNMQSFEKVLDGKFSYGLFNGEEKIPDADFVFASFQTMAGHKEEFAPDTFSYIVVDEAHHAPAKTFRTVIDYFQPDFLLGMTATPKRPDGLKLEDVFGPIAYNLGLIEAIKKGLLVDIDYHLILDEMAELDSLTIDGEKISMKELNRRLFIPKRDEEIVQAVSKRLSKYPNSSTLIFCRTIKHAKNISRLLDGSEVIHSKMSPDKNKDTLERFRRGELSTVISVDQLNEGIDIPHADVIVFLRSTASQIIFYQQLGRGLRLHKGKDRAVVLDFAGNYKRLQTLAETQQELNTPDDANEKISDETTSEDAQDKHFILNIESTQFVDKQVDIFDLLDNINKTVFSGWSPEELIAQVQILAQELGRAPTMEEFGHDSRTAGYNTPVYHFGSWNKFLKAAGLKPLRVREFSTEELIAQVQMLAQELGHTPTVTEFDRDPRVAGVSTAANRFGGKWTKFLKAAGLRPNKMTSTSTEELIAQVQMLAQELGHTPSQKEFDKDPKTASTGPALARFDGSWNKFIEAAGLKPRWRTNVSTEELITQAQMLAKELGHAPTQNEFNQDSRTASADTAMKRFDGKWTKFLEAAGLKSQRSGRNISAEELITQVQMLAKELGHAPTVTEFDRDPRTTDTRVIKRRFGGEWNNFLEAADLKPWQPGISAEELITQVQMLAKELGRTPTLAEFKQDPRTASNKPIIKCFGSWNNLLKAAGLETKQPKRNKISVETMIAQVQMLAKEFGRPPTYIEFNQDPRTASTSTAIRNFSGKWSEFLKAAGLK